MKLLSALFYLSATIVLASAEEQGKTGPVHRTGVIPRSPAFEVAHNGMNLFARQACGLNGQSCTGGFCVCCFHFQIHSCGELTEADSVLSQATVAPAAVVRQAIFAIQTTIPPNAAFVMGDV